MLGRRRWCVATVVAGLTSCFAATPEEHVRAMVAAAEHSMKPQPWTDLMMRADAEAEKLAMSVPCGPPGRERRLEIGEGVALEYWCSEIFGGEGYRHSLLRKIVRELPGTTEGANALVLLLDKSGPCNLDVGDFFDARTEGLPLHRRLIGMLSSERWSRLRDIRLTRVLAQAHETWWVLSRLPDDDPLLQDAGVRAEAFAEGAEAARLRAIELYRSDPDAAELRKRVVRRPRWYCPGD